MDLNNSSGYTDTGTLSITMDIESSDVILQEPNDLRSSNEVEVSVIERANLRSGWFNLNELPSAATGRQINAMATFWRVVLTDDSFLNAENRGQVLNQTGLITLANDLPKVTTNLTKESSRLHFFYIRKCYRECYENLFNSKKAFIEGVSGIGKSVFGLYFILRQLMAARSERRPCLILYFGVNRIPGLLFGVGEAIDNQSQPYLDFPQLQPFFDALTYDTVTMMKVTNPGLIGSEVIDWEYLKWEKNSALVVCDPGAFDNDATKQSPLEVLPVGEKRFLFIVSNSEMENQQKYNIISHMSLEDAIQLWTPEEQQQLLEIENFVEISNVEIDLAMFKRVYRSLKKDKMTDLLFKPFAPLLLDGMKAMIKTIEGKNLTDEEALREFLRYRFHLAGGSVRFWFQSMDELEARIPTYLKFRWEGKLLSGSNTEFRLADKNSILGQFNEIFIEADELKKLYSRYVTTETASGGKTLEDIYALVWTGRNVNQRRLMYAVGDSVQWKELRQRPVFASTEPVFGKTLLEIFGESGRNFQWGVYYKLEHVTFPVLDAVDVVGNKLFGGKSNKASVLLFQTTGGSTHRTVFKQLVLHMQALRDEILPKLINKSATGKGNWEVDKSFRYYYVFNHGFQERFKPGDDIKDLEKYLKQQLGAKPSFKFNVIHVKHR